MLDPAAIVTCDADLEAVVGERPAPSMLKSIDHLDEHCAVLLAHSPFVVVGTVGPDGSLQAFAVGGAAGFATPLGDRELALGPVDRPVVDGAPAGLIALVPGYGETLRINGILRVHDEGIRLQVDEAFLHCAKAIIRSGLWKSGDAPAAAFATAEDLLDAAPFALLATIDKDGNADVSPKGDPAGLLRRLDDATIAIADRPGNLRTDTLHNLMSRPDIALLAVVPESGQVVEVRGTATVSTDSALLDSLALRERTPKAAVVINARHTELRTEHALIAGDLWNHDNHVARDELPRGAKVWVDHVRRNEDPSAYAKALREQIDEGEAPLSASSGTTRTTSDPAPISAACPSLPTLGPPLVGQSIRRDQARLVRV